MPKLVNSYPTVANDQNNNKKNDILSLIIVKGPIMHAPIILVVLFSGLVLTTLVKRSKIIRMMTLIIGSRDIHN